MKKLIIALTLLIPGSLLAVSQYPTGATHEISFFSYTPTFRHGYSRLGRLNFAGPTAFRPKWTFTTGKAIFSSPVVDLKGRIIFGSRDDHLYCLDKKGTLLWKFKAGGDIDSTVTVDKKGNIYFGADDFHFYALSSSGSLKWKVKLYGEIRASALILPSGLIVVPDHNGYLNGIKDGQIKWQRYLSGGWCNASPSYSPATKLIYVVNNRSNLAAVDESGNIKWSKYMPGYSYNGKVQNGTVLIGKNGNLYFSSQTGVFSYTPQGKQRWHLKQIRTYTPPTMTMTGDLVVVDTAGYLHKFTTSGKIIYKKKVCSSTTYSSILVDAKDRIYFGSRDDKFYALDAQGNELFNYLAGNDVETSPTLSPSGVLYFGTDWGKLHAIH